MKIRVFILAIILGFIICLGIDISLVKSQPPPQIIIQSLEPISKKDNILILAPHPDDETLGCAGIIQRALKVGAKVHVVYLTNGDSNQLAFIVYEKRLVFKKKAFLHMGEVRRKESISAMSLLGVPPGNLIFLGYPDFGTMAIFKNYWNSNIPFRSLLTRVSSVPYPENFSFGQPYKADSILSDMKEILKRIRPNKIFVTSPVDTNGDHRALYLFLRLAILDLGGDFSKNIRVYSYLIHRYNWPKPRHYHPDLRLFVPQDALRSDYFWYNFDLTSQEIKNKHKALLAYKSQTETSAFYLLSFARKNELFLNVPDIKLVDSSTDKKLNWSAGLNALLAKEDTGFDIDESILNDAAISFAQKDKKLLIKINPSKQPIITSFSVYLFGYKKQTAFSLMPKIRVKIIGTTISVFDGRQKLDFDEISLKKEGIDIIVTLPLKALNDPEKILCSVNVTLRGLPHDSNAWRILILK